MYTLHPFFFSPLSLYAFPTKGALGYEANITSIFFFFFLSLYAFSPKGALGYEAITSITSITSFIYASLNFATWSLLFSWLAQHLRLTVHAPTQSWYCGL